MRARAAACGSAVMNNPLEKHHGDEKYQEIVVSWQVHHYMGFYIAQQNQKQACWR
jgi:hypothetical protein